MSIKTLSDVEIKGISCAVPAETWTTEQFETLLGKENAPKFEQMTGIKSRRVTAASVCTSDLCYEAALDVLSKTATPPSEIDTLIFISQTPDFVLPATACVLQERLKLSTTTVAFDINLGCSGYVYGLWLAFTLVSAKQSGKTLLLVGDTCTKFVSFDDKSTAPLFGDAGSATLIAPSTENQNAYFDLGTDGKGAPNLIIPSGGFRSRPTTNTAKSVSQPDGTRRSEQDLYMKGGEIFNFTIGTVGQAIQRFKEEIHTNPDAYVFHQANMFMLEHLRKKLKLSTDQLWFSLEEFGNTSSASIPLTIVSEYQKQTIHGSKNLFLAGFGVGYSWALAYLKLPQNITTNILEITKCHDH